MYPTKHVDVAKDVRVFSCAIDRLQCPEICMGRKLSFGEYEGPCACDRGSVPANTPNIASSDLQSFLRYWLSLRDDGSVPERQEFDAIQVRSLLSRFWIIRKDMETGRYRFLLAGEQIRNLLGRRVANVLVDDLFGEHAPALNTALDHILDTPALHYTVGPIYRAGMHPVHTERLALPMAQNGTVNTVYGATLYRKPVNASGLATEYANVADPIIVPIRELPCRGCLII